jgi:hypothetical protein
MVHCTTGGLLEDTLTASTVCVMAPLESSWKHTALLPTVTGPFRVRLSVALQVVAVALRLQGKLLPLGCPATLTCTTPEDTTREESGAISRLSPPAPLLLLLPWLAATKKQGSA